jgi:hypothetical protein
MAITEKTSAQDDSWRTLKVGEYVGGPDFTERRISGLRWLSGLSLTFGWPAGELRRKFQRRQLPVSDRWYLFNRDRRTGTDRRDWTPIYDPRSGVERRMSEVRAGYGRRRGEMCSSTCGCGQEDAIAKRRKAEDDRQGEYWTDQRAMGYEHPIGSFDH